MIAASGFQAQFSDFRFERREEARRRGKSEHQRAASPLTAGRLKEFQISNFKFEVSEEKLSSDDKCNREETSRPCFRILRSGIRNAG